MLFYQPILSKGGVPSFLILPDFGYGPDSIQAHSTGELPGLS